MTMSDTPEKLPRRVLAALTLIGLQDVPRIVMATERVQIGDGFVDYQKLVGAGELANSINGELFGLRDIRIHFVGELPGSVAG